MGIHIVCDALSIYHVAVIFDGTRGQSFKLLKKENWAKSLIAHVKHQRSLWRGNSLPLPFPPKLYIQSYEPRLPRIQNYLGQDQLLIPTIWFCWLTQLPQPPWQIPISPSPHPTPPHPCIQGITLRPCLVHPHIWTLQFPSFCIQTLMKYDVVKLKFVN